MDRLWRSNSSISSRTGCPLDIVNDEDHNVEKHGASVLMCLHDAKSKNSKNIAKLLVKKKMVVNLLTLTFLPLIILIMLSN